MRNNITLLIILISVALLIYIGTQGIKIGEIEILSVEQLIEKNQQLEEKIEEASKLTATNYPENIGTLEETYEKYKVQKQKYEQLAGTIKESKNKSYEVKQYDIGYLWRLLGSYATKRNVDLGIQVQKSSISSSAYNIQFAVNGKYVNISQFITDIENDSDLYFRIYNFAMSGSGETILGTFEVKNLKLDPSTIS